MEKSFRHILFLIVIMLLSVGCYSNRVDEVVVSREFKFHVAVTPYTKAGNDLSHPSEIPLGVWSFSEDGTTYLDNEKLSQGGDGRWYPEKQKIWNENVDEMDFIAYSPYGRGTYDDEYGICFDSYHLDEGLDIMYCDPILDQNKEYSQAVINVNMQRALALVRFKVRAVIPDHTDLKLKRLYVDGIHDSGDFSSLPCPYWCNLSGQQTYCFFEGEHILDDNAELLGKGLYMIPQMSQITINLLCDIITGESILKDQILSLTTTSLWNPGKITTHIVKVDGNLDLSIEKSNE